jgi:hypothetical protein
MDDEISRPQRKVLDLQGIPDLEGDGDSETKKNQEALAAEFPPRQGAAGIGGGHQEPDHTADERERPKPEQPVGPA